METENSKNDWVYVLIQAPGADEQLIGQHDAESDIAYIPAFMNKENAMSAMGRLARTKGQKVEIQAIILEDLVTHAAGNGFCIFMLDEEGRVLKKLSPEGDTL